MNLTIFAVVAAVVILVPTALFATFATTKDTYQYARHYGQNGYTQEIQSDMEFPRDEVRPEDAAHGAAQEPPVVDWPTEL